MPLVQVEEQWALIEDFPFYEISSWGRVYNTRTSQFMSVTPNNHGAMRISLVCEESYEVFQDGEICLIEGTRRVSKSVARMVAEAFLEQPSPEWDQVIILDGDYSNVKVYNLAWRPRGFAWEYTHQLRTQQPVYYQNLPVRNTVDNLHYNSIVEAGMAEGLLFRDIWRSTYSGVAIFPNGSRFEVV